MDKFEFGRRMKQLRRRRGLSQLEVRDAIRPGGAKRAAISTSYLSLIENGKRVPSLSVLDRLMETYGVLGDDELEEEYYELESWLTNFHKGLQDSDGHIRVPRLTSVGDNERVEWAYKTALSHPDYPDAQSLIGVDMPLPAKRFIVELYQKATGIQLLPDEQPKIIKNSVSRRKIRFPEAQVGQTG